MCTTTLSPDAFPGSSPSYHYMPRTYPVSLVPPDNGANPFPRPDQQHEHAPTVFLHAYSFGSERLLRSALCFTNSKLLLHSYHFYRDIIFQPGFLCEDRCEFPRLPGKVYSKSFSSSIKARRPSRCPDQDLSDLVLQRTAKLAAKIRMP
jgi:hypothetical protein